MHILEIYYVSIPGCRIYLNYTSIQPQVVGAGAREGDTDSAIDPQKFSKIIPVNFNNRKYTVLSKEIRKYTDKQTLFLENLAGPAKGNIRAAMDLAGYDANHSTTLIVRSLRDEIIDIAKDMLAGTAIKSIFALDEVLDNPAALGNNAKIMAAKELLDRAGIVKPSENAQLSLQVPDGGVIILPAKRVLKEPEVIDVTPVVVDTPERIDA